MADKITLRFKLDNLQKIGFNSKNLPEEVFEGLQSLNESGIEIISGYFDDLCKNTINNGHNLLKSSGIFSIETSLVNPMSMVIGQFLFRLLFGNTKFQNYLHRVKKENQEIEIVLEFDLLKKESKVLASLPWELMYCPENKNFVNSEEAEEGVSNGFFVSNVASVFRRYHYLDEIEIPVKREVYVSVAFLTKDVDNLKEVYDNFTTLSGEIEKKNSNIHFEFINPANEANGSVYLLATEDLGKIFLSDKNKTSPEVNKIVHIICDISTTLNKEKTENSLYFNNTGNVEKISYTDIFQKLFSKTFLPDPYLKLVVLQAWKDENRFFYPGFEEIANRIIRTNKTNQNAVISMPYILNKRSDKDGKATFFETLYCSLANSLSTIQTVQKLRNDIVPGFSYGFPLLYMNGPDQVLVSKEPISPQALTNTTSMIPGPPDEILLKQYEHSNQQTLENNRKLLVAKLNAFQRELPQKTDTAVKYEISEEIKKMTGEIYVIDYIMKKAPGNP